jgi:hypothetical protein
MAIWIRLLLPVLFSPRIRLLVHEHPAPEISHHLDFALAISDFGHRIVHDASAARSYASRVFGFAGDRHDQRLLHAMSLLCAGRLAEARDILRQIGLETPARIPAVCNVLAAVFKYFNAGLNIRELAEFGMEPMLAMHKAHPACIELRRALLDLLLYFGCADDAEHLLGQGAVAGFETELQELARYRARLACRIDRCRLSLVVLTWRRPALLQHTLDALRVALAETDVELIIGVNDDLPETRMVVERSGADKVLFSPKNIGLELYKSLFELAEGQYIIEVDDDVFQFPVGFDRQIIECLEARPDLGFVGHWPVSFVDAVSGASLPPAESLHQRDTVAGHPFGYGPVAGACAGIRREDFLMINGFSRAALTHHSGEEPQLIRKLAVYGRLSGVILDQGLIVSQNA